MHIRATLSYIPRIFTMFYFLRTLCSRDIYPYVPQYLPPTYPNIFPGYVLSMAQRHMLNSNSRLRSPHIHRMAGKTIRIFRSTNIFVCIFYHSVALIATFIYIYICVYIYCSPS